MRDYWVCHCRQCQAFKNPKKKRIMRRHVRHVGRAVLHKFLWSDAYGFGIRDQDAWECDPDWQVGRMSAPYWDFDWK